MASVFYSSGDEPAETAADAKKDREFNFEISRRNKNDDQSHDIETKESDEETNMNNADKADIDSITPDKDYGFWFKNPIKTLENVQPRGNIVRDGMMKARPDIFEDDYGYVVDGNVAGDTTASLTSEVESSSNPSVPGEGMLNSRPTEETVNSPCKCKLVEGVAEQEVKFIRYNNRALPKHAETYQLETFEKNAMIIFNQKNIDGYKDPREGTEKDVDALTKTFSHFGFEIDDPYNDLRRDQIFEELDRFSKKDFTDYGCVAVVILTHGSDNGSLCAKEGWDKEFYETDVIDYFRTSVNETLVTKPILIIIQACRGKKVSKAKTVRQPGTVREDSHDKDQSYTLPLESDMLVLHSTYPGNVSHRNDLYGSWFIEKLCKKINQLSSSQHLESIMIATKRAVAIDMEHSCKNRVTYKYEINKQMPVTTSTLIRKLYLRKHKGCIPKSITREFETQVDGCSLNGNGSIDDAESVTDKERIGSPGLLHPNWSSYFDYLKGMLRHFVEDPSNSEDNTARNYLSLTCTYKDGIDFNESKEKMSNVITEHLNNNAKHLEYYKFLYLNNFAVSKKTNGEHSSLNTKTSKNEIIKQIPVTMFTLMRNLFFWGDDGCDPKSNTRDSETQVNGCSHTAYESETDQEHPDPFHPNWSNYFDYLKGMLRHFVEDPCNSEDIMAKSYFSLACTYKDTAEFHESKEKMSNIITEHLQNHAKHLDYYKFLYLNNFGKS